MISGVVGHPITVETIINGTVIVSYFLENRPWPAFSSSARTTKFQP